MATSAIDQQRAGKPSSLRNLASSRNPAEQGLAEATPAAGDPARAAIESKLEKKKKTQMGAPAGKRVVIFVDDVNMPTVETYGAQPPVELMRQYADHKGFYDRSKLFWKEIVDTVIVGAAAPPASVNAFTVPVTTETMAATAPAPAAPRSRPPTSAR